MEGAAEMRRLFLSVGSLTADFRGWARIEKLMPSTVAAAREVA
jgi:hypothetical protein